MPSTQPSSRLAARLGQLPQGVLANLAAQLCSDSPALQAAAEECMAAHNPLPHEMVERVLLSPDLVPHILGPLEAEDGAAAAVCSLWLDGWKATNEPRRRLKQVPLDLPEQFVISEEFHVAATPDGRLVVRTGSGVHILDRSMRVLQTLAGTYSGLIAANDDSIFYVSYDPHQLLHRISHDGTTAAEYRHVERGSIVALCWSGGLLFCVVFNGDTDCDEIIALDAQTMQLRHRFGRGLLNDARQLSTARDELYVCDSGNHRLQVFSLTGEHRRSIMGEWRSPLYICSAKDRLYLIEQEDEEDADEGEDTNPLKGRRIFVLSLQGNILQVVTYPTEPTAVFESICCFDRKLLTFYKHFTEFAGFTEKTAGETYGMFALQGL